MKKSSNSRSSMFLMEIIIAILFFSLASAVCLRIFTRSHQLSNGTNDLNMAVNQASSTAELFRSYYGNMNMVRNQYPDAYEDDQGFTLYYDNSWKYCQIKNASYCMTVIPETSQEQQQNGLISYNIEVNKLSGHSSNSESNQKTSANIYTLSVTVHKPNVP